MSWLDAIILGIIEGVTEFLPISSTGHLTIAQKLMGYQINDPEVTAFTAVIQIGAILAAILYFRSDIWRVGVAWLKGLFDSTARQELDYKFGWAIVVGSLPIAAIGLLFQDQIETTFRSLWFVAAGLLGWSAVMWLADRKGTQVKGEKDVTWKDTLMIGLAQCLALIPGVSRSGATMSAGLLAGFDRVTATRLAFFLGIPALTAAGIFQAIVRFDDIGGGVIGWVPTIIATVVSFIVGYVVIAWLLRFIATHDFTAFIYYRVVVGLLIVALLLSGTISHV